jgi:ATP-dependent Clp protease, protease subunit
MPNYRVRMAGSKAAEIYLYDQIGGGFFGGGISAKQFADDLKDLGKIDTLNVRVNSPGGDVFDGLAIYNTLKRHPANVIMDIDGMALSIASIIVMAGDEINMAKNAMMMIHDPWTFAGGTAEDFRKQADLMDQVKGNLVTTYADRTKMDAQEIDDLMAAETWFTADDAKANGFVDSVTEDLALAARFDLTHFRNAPKLLAKVSPRPAPSDLFRSKIAAMTSRAKQISGR